MIDERLESLVCSYSAPLGTGKGLQYPASTHTLRRDSGGPSSTYVLKQEGSTRYTISILHKRSHLKKEKDNAVLLHRKVIV